jgi:putative transposase
LKTIHELASEYRVHPNQISEWKRQLLEAGSTLFSRGGAGHEREQQEREVALYEHIGRLNMELEWLKKKLAASVEGNRAMIDLSHPHLSIRRPCELIGLNRSTFYGAPATASPLNLQLMRLIDAQYTKTPCYGWPRMTAHVRRLGWPINHQRVQRLMQQMGLQAMYHKPRTSVAAPDHTISPYLLGTVEITRPNQVWRADMTYVPMSQGFMYLMAILDWCRRYVLAWELSNTLDTGFCLEALERALEDGCPAMFNTDQGVQFTSLAFTTRWERAGVGRWTTSLSNGYGGQSSMKTST